MINLKPDSSSGEQNVGIGHLVCSVFYFPLSFMPPIADEFILENEKNHPQSNKVPGIKRLENNFN